MIFIRNIVFVSILILLSISDIRKRTIPNPGIAALFVFAISSLGFDQHMMTAFCSRMISAVIIAAAVLAVVKSTDSVLTARTMGMGDVKLIFVIAVYLGFWNTVYALFGAFAIALIYILLTTEYMRDRLSDNRIPLGPFISLAAGISALMSIQY